MKLIRTNAKNEDFLKLIDILNIEQAKRNGDKNEFYMQFNHLDEIHHVLVAYNGEKPVGCGALRKYNETSMEVKRMFTLMEERGKGIAKAILEELEKWTVELGHKSCILETGTMNPEAIQLYKKCNYKQIPNFGQYANDEDSLCFEKEFKVLKTKVNS